MTVYADILFLTNLFVNAVILYLSQKISYLKPKYFNIILAAAFGALYAVAVFVMKFGFLNTLILKLVVSAAMVYIVNGIMPLKKFLRVLAALYAVSFLCCGAAMGVSYVTGANKMPSVYGTMFIGVSFGGLVCAVIITAVTVFFASRLKRRKQSRSFENITIGLFDKSISVKALVDTGNLLYEPISGYPVVIAEYESIKQILPPMFNPDDGGQCQNLKIRYIPYNALGNNGGLMVGFVPDFVKTGGRYIKCCVAVYNGILSKGNEYGALISPEICCNDERSKTV